MDWKDVSNRLASRGAGRECVQCGGENWLPLRVEDVQEAGIPVYVVATGKPIGYIDVATLTCRNCGLLRLHSLEALGYQDRHQIHRGEG